MNNTCKSPSDKKLHTDKKVLALSGGVGGAKLALGLSKILSAEQLVIVANTADDFQHLGLEISPDLDTLMYTLAGVNNHQQGWGVARESWNVMGALEDLGCDSWFRLGDRDLATHLRRTQQLSKGHSLSAITRDLCHRLGVTHPLIPMSDDIVRTRVALANANGPRSGPDVDQSPKQELSFQEYFVREQCKPAVSGFRFDGIERAKPQTQLAQLLEGDQLAAIIICPSNPFVSVAPILQLPGVRQAMRDNPAPVIAVSPIVRGQAIKGPTAKIMAELNMPLTALSLARYYGELLDGFVVDTVDEILLPAIEDLGLHACCAPTIMETLQDRIDLADNIMSFAQLRFTASPLTSSTCETPFEEALEAEGKSSIRSATTRKIFRTG